MCIRFDAGKGAKDGAATANSEQEMASEPPPVVPSETIYMQIIDFLLDTKAMPVCIKIQRKLEREIHHEICCEVIP